MDKSKNTKHNKSSEPTSKKKRSANDSIEDLLSDPSKHLSKKIEELDVKSDSEYFSEGSDEDVIDEEEDDNSEDYVEKDYAQDQDDNTTKKSKKVSLWNEKTNKLEKEEVLDFDNEAYDMLHRAKVEWPCLSIDFVVPENFYPPVKSFYDKAADRKKIFQDKFPYTTYMIAGSQTSSENGFLYLMKWSNMQKTKYDDDPDISEDGSNVSNDTDPFMKFEKVGIKGNVNRIKAMKNSYLTAYWSDSANIEIVDLRQLFPNVDDGGNGIEEEEMKSNIKKRKVTSKNIGVKTFKRSLEGFALDWSCLTPGLLAAGGYDKKIELYAPRDEMCSDFVLRDSILKGHTDSIEDICWSPFQDSVLASCSVDKSIRFWDLRAEANSKPIVIENAHKSDVNVISWNGFCSYMVASGGDDGVFKVWDLRHIGHGPISNIAWHKGPITTIAWDPYEDSQIAVASEDNRLSVWDFSVEPDDKQLFDNSNQEIPQQLVFLHQGQENIKDLKFHPYYKDIICSTAETGINVFKPAFQDDGVKSVGSGSDRIDEEEEHEFDNDEEMEIDTKIKKSR